MVKYIKRPKDVREKRYSSERKESGLEGRGDVEAGCLEEDACKRMLLRKWLEEVALKKSALKKSALKRSDAEAECLRLEHVFKWIAVQPQPPSLLVSSHYLFSAIAFEFHPCCGGFNLFCGFHHLFRAKGF